MFFVAALCGRSWFAGEPCVEVVGFGDHVEVVDHDDDEGDA